MAVIPVSAMKVMVSQFWLVFAAENSGDKTYLAGIACAAKYGFWVSFAPTGLALLFSAILSATIGTFLKKQINFHYVELVSGVLFVGIGAWTLWGALKPH